MPASGTERTCQCTVHMDRGTARHFMQSVHVLGDDHHLARILGLQPCQREVGGVWLRRSRLLAARVIKPVHQMRITGKPVRCGNILDPVLRPKPAFVPKGA